MKRILLLLAFLPAPAVALTPDVVTLVDDVEAAAPAPFHATFQWVLHAQAPFTIEDQQLRLDRTKAGLRVDYVAEEPLQMRHGVGAGGTIDGVFGGSAEFATVRKGGHTWRLQQE